MWWNKKKNKFNNDSAEVYLNNAINFLLRDNLPNNSNVTTAIQEIRYTLMSNKSKIYECTQKNLNKYYESNEGYLLIRRKDNVE